MVKGSRRKPPARIRYEESHPVVSCRVDRDTYDLLKQRLEDLGGASVADFVKDSLGLLQLKMPDMGKTREIKERDRKEGYVLAAEEHQIWYFCAVCGKRIDMSPNDDSHRALMGYMKEHGWGHRSCHEQ